MDNSHKILKSLDDETTFALQEFLTRISRIYAHKLGNPLIKARLAIDDLLDRVRPRKEPLEFSSKSAFSC